jgi:hypothetical protein
MIEENLGGRDIARCVPTVMKRKYDQMMPAVIIRSFKSASTKRKVFKDRMGQKIY